MNDRHFDLPKKVLLPIRNAVRKGNRLHLLTAGRRSYDDKIDLEGNSVERMLDAWLGLAVSESASFFIKSSIFLFASVPRSFLLWVLVTPHCTIPCTTSVTPWPLFLVIDQDHQPSFIHGGFFARCTGTGRRAQHLLQNHAKYRMADRTSTRLNSSHMSISY